MGGGRHPGKVAAARAETYEAAALSAAVERVLGPFGGAGEICAGRTRVLLKPNVLRPSAPEEAVTTHPEFVRAVARAFLSAGCTVAVGDSPGGDPGPAGPAFEKCGIAAVCRELGIPLLNFQKEGSRRVALPDCPASHINVALPVVEADVIVNLPKLKTHTLTQLTCALKNPYGYIPGFLKAKLHALAPRIDEFCRIVCAIWQVLPPAFTLVDAVVAMQGPGPSGGEPYRAGWVLGGTDPVAIDALLAAAMGFDLQDVTLIEEARRRGLGVADPARIEVLGGTSGQLAFPGFALPRASPLARWAPRWALHLASRMARPFFWVRPAVRPDACERCHRCVRTCPTGAMQGRAGDVPRLALPRACISCLCCQEVCPAKAIEARKSFFVTRIFRARGEGEGDDALRPPADGAGPPQAGALPHR